MLRDSLAARRRAGAAFLLALGAAVGGVLLASGRSLGRGVRFEVALAHTGALRSDARVRIAGREAGEVRAIRPAEPGAGQAGRGVLVEAFVASAWAGEVRKNSSVFVATPSILGEAYLEIGPALDAAGRPGEPGPPISDGDRVRGIDPPEIDRFIAHVYDNLAVIAGLLREHRPEIDELLAGGDELLAILSGLPADPGQLGRIRDHAALAMVDALAIADALREADALPRLRGLAAELGGIADRAGPELSALGEKADRAVAHLDGIAALWAPERRAQLERALRGLQAGVTAGERLLADARVLARGFARGQGTLGAFAADREIYDDFHETHGILKHKPWTLIVKPSRKATRVPSLPPQIRTAPPAPPPR